MKQEDAQSIGQNKEGLDEQSLKIQRQVAGERGKSILKTAMLVDMCLKA